MRKGYREYWSRLGWIEKTLLVLLAIYALLKVTGLSSTWQFITAVAVFVFGSAALIRLTYALTRKAIWRLRNRLIAAYLFIAVVPIILILLLAGLAGYTLVGQGAAYFVRTELANRGNSVLQRAEQLAGMGGPAAGGRGRGAPGRSSGSLFCPNRTGESGKQCSSTSGTVGWDGWTGRARRRPEQGWARSRRGRPTERGWRPGRRRRPRVRVPSRWNGGRQVSEFRARCRRPHRFDAWGPRVCLGNPRCSRLFHCGRLQLHCHVHLAWD